VYVRRRHDHLLDSASDYEVDLMMPTPQCIDQVACPKCGLPLTEGSMKPVKRLRSWRTGELVATMYQHISKIDGLKCREQYAERAQEEAPVSSGASV
jgi:hypothetical protein